MGIASQSNIIRILSGYNQWWHLRSVQKQFLKPTQRTVYAEILKLLDDDKIRVIHLVGPHRTGKTALIHQVIQNLIDSDVDPKQIIHMNFGHPFFSFLPPFDIYKTYRESICPNVSKRTFCFCDDIQLSPEWQKNVEEMTSAFSEITVILTSSIRPENVGENQRLLNMPPISFYEYCQIATGSEKVVDKSILPGGGILNASTNDLKRIANTIAQYRHFFRHYMYTGGFLNLVGETDDIRIQRMIQRTVVGDALLRDISICFSIRNTIDLEKIFLYLCLECPRVISFEALMREIDCVTRPTIEKYIKYLRSACLVYQCMPQENEGERIQKMQPKLYLADASIHNSLLMLNDIRINEGEGNMEKIVETAVYRHLRFYGPDSEEGQISYNRTRTSGKNLDMILNGRKKIHVDVRFDSNMRLSKKDAIISKAGKADICLVITKDENMFGYVPNLPRNIFFIPADVFLFMIGQAKSDNHSFLDGI